MNNKSITPNPQQPVDRVPTGQLPSALAELSEAKISAGAGVLPLAAIMGLPTVCSGGGTPPGYCSYDGDDE